MLAWWIKLYFSTVKRRRGRGREGGWGEVERERERECWLVQFRTSYIRFCALAMLSASASLVHIAMALTYTRSPCILHRLLLLHVSFSHTERNEFAEFHFLLLLCTQKRVCRVSCFNFLPSCARKISQRLSPRTLPPHRKNKVFISVLWNYMTIL